MYEFCHSSQVQEIRRMCDSPSIKDMQPSDQKFLFIPVAFLLLRLGSLIFSVLYVYTDVWIRMTDSWHLVVQFYMVTTVTLLICSCSHTMHAFLPSVTCCIDCAITFVFHGSAADHWRLEPRTCQWPSVRHLHPSCQTQAVFLVVTPAFVLSQAPTAGQV